MNIKDIYIVTQSSSQKISVKAEVAADDASRMQGLMFRKSLGKNEGMIFIFPSNTKMPFWMKNTYIPLDIIFIDQDQKIISIAENTIPFSEEMIESRGFYRYALEMNAGFVKQHKIKPGDRVEW